MSIQQLIALLFELEKNDSITSSDYLADSIPIVNEIVNLANELLITNNGHCNYKNMSVLENNNFNVAGINTDKGVIIYG